MSVIFVYLIALAVFGDPVNGQNDDPVAVTDDRNVDAVGHVVQSLKHYQNLIEALQPSVTTKSRNLSELKEDMAWASLISFVVLSIIAILLFVYMRKREARVQEKKQLVPLGTENKALESLP